MTESLPEPKSRKESYLAKAAGMEVSVPEAPESREEQYLAAIAEGGGGGTTYTAGEGITIADDTISVDTTTIQPKLTAGSNVTIADNTISATDTTYNAFTGTDGTSAGTSGLVPAPATTDAGKFLKADGTWDTAGGGGPTIVQTTGTSTTDVMSQDATSKMIFPNPSDKNKIVIGNTVSDATTYSIAIGGSARCIVQSNGVAIGNFALCKHPYSISLGASGSGTTEQGQLQLGLSGPLGYNNSTYRIISGVYDGQSAHDAATYGQLNTRLDGLTLLKISQTDYDNLQTKDANTLYVITGA